MRKLAVVACLISLLALGAAAKKKKASVDPRIMGAQFVRVVSATGNDLDPRTLSDDRAAISRVEGALQRWGRFRIVYNDQDADILLVVRPGRYMSVGAGPTISTGGPIGGPGEPGPTGGAGGRVGVGGPGTPGPGIGGPGIGIGGQVEAANVPEDMISIYDARVGGNAGDQINNSSVLWRKVISHGLGNSVSDKVPLVEELRKEIEAASAPAKVKP